MPTSAHVAAMVPRTVDMRRALEGWPAESLEAVIALQTKYGPPQEVRPTLIVWNENGPWKRTMVHHEVVEHRWPTPHLDVLEQVLDHAVAPERIPDLAHFHGSILVDRTRGELIVRCADEAANFLAANLAHDIIEGHSDAVQARRAYVTSFLQRHRADPYVVGLRFGRQLGTRDPDEPDESRDVYLRRHTRSPFAQNAGGARSAT